jgi:hypothetical protein
MVICRRQEIKVAGCNLDPRYPSAKLSVMNSKDFTREQAQQIRESLLPALGYLSRLKQRMDQTRFPSDDPVYRDVLKAQEAMQGLTMRLHYLTCSGATGDPRGRQGTTNCGAEKPSELDPSTS